MKIVHTADLHIGKILYGKSLIEDQKEFLLYLYNYIVSENIDLLIIAGDLYDRATPSKESIILLDDFFTKIILDTNCRIIAIAGNHDSAERIEVSAQMLKKMNLHLIGEQRIDVKRIDIEDISVYPLPFCDISTLSKIYNKKFKSINDAINYQVKLIKKQIDNNRFNICITHSYIAKIKNKEDFNDSERPIIMGDIEFVVPEIFDIFDYTAAGHLHRSHFVGKEKIRYSGSPIKYSLSEVNNKKSFIRLDINHKSLRIKKELYKPKRDLIKLEGYFKDLILEKSDDYICFFLKDKKRIKDAMRRLLISYPNALKMSYDNIQEESSFTKFEKDMISNSTVEELFSYFYKYIKKEDMSDEEKSIIVNITTGGKNETSLS